MKKQIHVIPVPRGMTPEESYEEIRLLGCLLTEHVPENDEDCEWAVMEVWVDDES